MTQQPKKKTKENWLLATYWRKKVLENLDNSFSVSKKWKFIKHSDFKPNKNIIKPVSIDGLELTTAIC